VLGDALSDRTQKPLSGSPRLLAGDMPQTASSALTPPADRYGRAFCSPVPFKAFTNNYYNTESGVCKELFFIDRAGLMSNGH
jgi:hypothetical protein